LGIDGDPVWQNFPVVWRKRHTAKGITNAPEKGVRDLTGAFQSLLRNHGGKTVVAVGQGMPVRWKLRERT
jgi:hypothetical protein